MTRPDLTRPGPTRPGLTGRAPLLLAAGHVVTGIAAITLLTRLVIDVFGSPPAATAVLPGQLLVAVAALAAVQTIGVHRAIRSRRALLERRLDEPALCAGARRVSWTALGAQLPILLGIHAVTASWPSTPELALLCATMCGSLLLDTAYAGWANGHLDRRGPQVRALPPGSGGRVRDKQVVVRVCLVLLGAVALVLASRPVIHLADDAAGPLPARLLGLGSPLAVMVLPLLLIRPVTTARHAVSALDAVHRPTLDTAARTLRRVGLLAVVPAGLVVAAVVSAPAASAPEAVLLAAAPAIPLALTLGTTAQQLATYTCISAADPQTLIRRRRGAHPPATWS